MNKNLIIVLVSILFSSATFANEFINGCDKYASDPADYDRVAPAVNDEAVNVELAKKACLGAVSFSTIPRLYHQFARALLISGNREEARKYLEKSAALNYTASQFYMGLSYEYKWFGLYDLKIAEKWYRVSANKGHSKAMFSLGLVLLNQKNEEQIDSGESVSWIERGLHSGRLEEKESLYAKVILGPIYLRGDYSKEKKALGVEMVIESAEAGLTQGQYILGLMYRDGINVDKNIEKSIHYLEKAANKNDEISNVSAWTLGDIYLNGLHKNKELGFKWYCKTGLIGENIYKKKYSNKINCQLIEKESNK